MSTYESLWRAVVTQALEDACSQPPSPNSNTNVRSKLDIDSARNWFERGGSDFREVCALAGLEADQVRRLALQEIAKADAAANAPIPTYEYKGRSLTAKEWAIDLGIETNPMNKRIAKMQAGTITPDQCFNAAPLRKIGAARQMHEFNGERLTLLEWCERYSMKVGTVQGRMSKGMTFKEALFTPPSKGRKPKASQHVCFQKRNDESKATNGGSMTPGVVENFPNTSGTGGGTVAPDLPLSELIEA